MSNFVKSSTPVTRICVHGFVACFLFLLSSQSVVIAAEVGDTTMTVVKVDKWINGPPSHEFHTVDTVMNYVVYQPGSVYWSTTPRRWGQTLPNGVTGNIWSIVTYNDGETYTATLWDYLSNSTSSKGRAHTVPDRIFTMLTSLCDQNGKCATPQKRRTNMVRFPPIVTDPGTIRIEPQHVGVFSSQETQTFTAYKGTTKLTATDVDWMISASPRDDTGLEPEEVATIDENGVATILSTKGTVKVSVCYPKGCGGGGGGDKRVITPILDLLLLRK